MTRTCFVPSVLRFSRLLFTLLILTSISVVPAHADGVDGRALSTPATAPLMAAVPTADAPTLSVGPEAWTLATETFYDRLRMVLVDPTGQAVETVTAGDRLTLSATGDDGAPRPDGTYRLEVWGFDPNSRRDVLLHAGSLTVADGVFADPLMAEAPAETANLEVNEDLFVMGSACVGVDCTTNMNFGFNTLVLRENNVRMLFEDTSASGTFPNNNWGLIANDSNNGGGNYFSIADCGPGGSCGGGGGAFTIEAGVSGSALYVDSQGRIGFGTSVPTANLHTVEGNTPTLRLEQDGSAGFSPQSWDVAGNEVNFFVRDQTNNQLPFRILAGALRDTLVLTGDSVGVGTSTPTARLDVQGDVAVSGLVDGRDVSEDGATLDELAAGQVDEQAGIVPGSAFGGRPLVATVTLPSAYPAGTQYVVQVTVAIPGGATMVIPANVSNVTATGFTIVLDSNRASDVTAVHWLTRPVG